MHLELCALVVDDYDEAIRFFVDLLGFELIEDSPSVAGDGRPKRWVVVRPPGPETGTGLLLARADGPRQRRVVGDQWAGRVGLFLRVDDFDAAHRRMVAGGVDFLAPPRDEPYGRVAVFVDLAGNRWDLLGPPGEGHSAEWRDTGRLSSPGPASAPAPRPGVIVRRERPGDETGVRAVQVAAFDQGEGEPTEARLVDALRACDGWLPELSWVAEIDGEIVGHCVSSRGYCVSSRGYCVSSRGYCVSSRGDVVDGVGTLGTPCVGLGPIGVAPAHQGSGVGSALVWATIGAADALGEPLIALLGSPAYYARFGFRASTEYGVEAPESAWGHHFQVRPLTAWSDSIAGRFRYAEPFDDLD